MNESNSELHRHASIGRLAGGVAHDFNNLLTTIHGYLHLLSMNIDPGGKSERYCEEIRKTLDRAAHLTQHLLLFSRDVPSTPGPLDLDAVVTGMVKLLNRIIGENVTLKTDLGCVAARVWGDEVETGRKVLDLVVEARDMLPNGGEITISTSVRGSSMRLQVDTSDAEGPHLPAVEFSVLEPEGIGPETIEPENTQAPCTGRTPATARDTDQDTQSVIANGAILLLENDGPLRDSLGKGLTAYGYRVVPVSNLGEARAILEQRTGEISFIVADVLLPDGSGADLTAHDSGAHDVPILFVSGYSGVHQGIEEIREQGHAFLKKPFSLETLIHMIENHPNRNM